MTDRIEDTYIIGREIGKGGGGTVYKAYHRRLKKDVVLKKIHSNLIGAFGTVYKAKCEQFGNVSYATIKVIHIPQDSSEIKDLEVSGMDFASIHSYLEDMVKNLMNEIKIMESLKSANHIVGIEDYEVLEHQEEMRWDIFIRMELLTSLGAYIQKNSLSVKRICDLGMHLCQALSACEREKIIHRDIKIDNVFVNQFSNNS